MTAETVRRANVADAAAVQGVVEEAYAGYVPRIGRRPAPMDQDYREVLAETDTWVVEHGGRVIGVLVTRTFADHLMVETLAVQPDQQRQGLGVRLLDLADAHGRAVGVPEVRLYTNEAMTENLAFYPRRGFRETGRGEQDGFRRVFFSKQL